MTPYTAQHYKELSEMKDCRAWKHGRDYGLAAGFCFGVVGGVLTMLGAFYYLGVTLVLP